MIPEEIVGTMLEEMWSRRDALEERLTDLEWEGDRGRLSRELAELETVLGLRVDGASISTGDPVTDYLMAKQRAGTITPEDLEMTPEKLRKMRGGRRG